MNALRRVGKRKNTQKEAMHCTAVVALTLYSLAASALLLLGPKLFSDTSMLNLPTW